MNKTRMVTVRKKIISYYFCTYSLAADALMAMVLIDSSKLLLNVSWVGGCQPGVLSPLRREKIPQGPK
jgi:hypothetical protein